MSNYCDGVGGSKLLNGSNYEFTQDRFGNANSAISFNKGFLKVSEGIYFSSDLTITAWVKLRAYEKFSQFLDFGNGRGQNNVMFGMFDKTAKIRFAVHDNHHSDTQTHTKELLLDKWYHVAAVLYDVTSFIYINGELIDNRKVNKPTNLTRKSNYIGWDNWAADSPSNATYDEIKIYNSPLTPEEILLDMSIGSNNSESSKLYV